MGQATKKQRAFAEEIAEKLKMKLPEKESFESLRSFINENYKQFYEVQKAMQEEVNKQNRDKIVNEIKILDYANEIGFTIIKKGKYFSLKEHDSVIIDADKNCFWRNSESGSGHSIGKGGSIIDFSTMFYHNGNLHNALTDLTSRIDIKTPVIYQPGVEKNKTYVPKTLELPKHAENMRRVYAYLLKSRYIDQDIVQNFVDKKMLYQDKNNNCVFVSYENGDIEKPVFACLRGTNTEKRFIGDVAGSNYSKGFYIDNGANKIIATESVIDAMSIMTILKKQGIDYSAYDYMPLAGVAKQEALINRVKEYPKEEVLLALDNDTKGRENVNNIRETLIENKLISPAWISEHFPEQKDWNKELQELVRKGKGFEEIKFFPRKENSIEKASENPQSYTQTCCKRASKERGNKDLKNTKEIER